jgi:lambda family phage minor tail protein L
MPINTDIQKPSVSPEVELFEISGFNPANPGETFRFCGLGSVSWQGQAYTAFPCKGSGFTLTSQSFPRPRLTIGNFELPGTGGLQMTAVCSQYNDFTGATVVRHTTLEKYLDGLPGANPLEEFDTTYWRVEQKLSDNEEAIEFELSFLGLEDTSLPRRKFFNNYCGWEYRSDQCGYVGGAVATISNMPTTNLALDRCSKNRVGCSLRFGDGVNRFGGVPGARFS